MSNHISFLLYFDIYVVGGISMLEKYDETVSEFATIVSKENDKGDVVVLVDTDDIKKKERSCCILNFMIMT